MFDRPPTYRLPDDASPSARATALPPPGALLDWLSRHVRRPLAFVVADAGYGKTTLLADFTQRGNVRCLWFKLDGVVVRGSRSCRAIGKQPAPGPAAGGLRQARRCGTGR